MTYTALARYRRSPVQEPTLRLIAFQLRHTWFCLPLAMARRVIPLKTNDPAQSLGFTQLNQENVPIMDVAERVYLSMPLLPSPISPTPHELARSPEVQCHLQQSILVVDSPQLGLLGLLVDGIPVLKRARQSAFSPVPVTYLVMHRLQGVNTLVTINEIESPLFFLEVDTLLS